MENPEDQFRLNEQVIDKYTEFTKAIENQSPEKILGMICLVVTQPSDCVKNGDVCIDLLNFLPLELCTGHLFTEMIDAFVKWIDEQGEEEE